jgi:hypothetical protein
MRTVDERIDALDEFSVYWPPDRPDPQPPVASGVTFRELYEAGLLSESLLDVLSEVVERVAAGGTVSDDQRLLDAWLFAFELRASVHEEDLGGTAR